MKTILVDAVYTFIIKSGDKFELNKSMHELLEKYPNKKIILTNASDDKYESYGLNNMPYEFFTLKHNPDKIDPKYFEIFLNQYNLKAEDVVYFEHDIEAVKSAKSVGINSYFYDENKKDLVELDNFLKTNL